MNRIITLIYIVFITSLVLIGCSELENNLTSVAKPGIHGEGVLNVNSPNFHGNYFDKLKFKDCQNCHAKNFQGGLTPVNCADANCHPAVKIHANMAGVNDQTSSNFHGRYLLKNSLSDCQQCHGDNFAGGLSSPSCVSCHSSISVHKAGLTDPSSANFHGKNTLSGNFANCQSCHGDNFTGGISSPSCTSCHSAITVHKTGINDPNSANFHGKYPIPNGFADCQGCHGSNFSGGNLSPSCATCHSAINVHKAGILNPASAEFHGKYQLTNGFSDCQSCHGEDFSGGTLSPSCRTCHSTINVHKIGILTPTSPDFHGKFLAANNWNLPDCKQCHGSNYSGGSISSSCLTCHSQPAGPEACNTCHGDFSNPSKTAPPQDLSGNTSTTFKGVGAHDKHLNTNSLGKTIECETCHTVPNSLTSSGHLDGNLPAEVNFTGLAIFNAAGNANYSSSTITCANTYCHGNFEFNKSDALLANQFAYSADKMIGANKSVVWNKVDGTEAVCGSCHGLPPIGHTNFGGLNTCVNCHMGVVNAQGQIINQQKHINGEKNVFGN
ncbi:MAG: hypothetical protein HXY50_07215 [Ignavibacteriaceae bacterium]|nr:hypothetical protein [Ignavibacteriaceae bacterium]